MIANLEMAQLIVKQKKDLTKKKQHDLWERNH